MTPKCIYQLKVHFVFTLVNSYAPKLVPIFYYRDKNMGTDVSFLYEHILAL